jgi:folate-binding protein YgfZ
LTAEAAPADVAAREYSAAREGSALVDLPDRRLLAVTGPQRIKFLHNIVSNDLQSRRPGQGTLAALMDVKGHLIALMRALVTEDAAELEMPSDRLDIVEPLLVHYRVGAPVRFARPPVVVLGLMGPRATDTMRQAGAELPAEMGREDHVLTTLGGRRVRIVRAGDFPAAGYVVHASPEDAASVSEALAAAGAMHVGPATLEVLRIEDGRPWYGPDIREDNLLHETGLLGEYHSPAKGCYIGQEVVARLEARGANVNKKLRGLKLDLPVPAGSPVMQDGREVGRVTTVGVSPRVGPIAMAYLHRGANEPGTAVEVDGRPAVVAALPLN